MFTHSTQDVTAMRIHLNELKSSFDRFMNEGVIFEKIKSVYLEIKELESQIAVLDWETPNYSKDGGNFFTHRIQ
jgi:hypothetical protein